MSLRPIFTLSAFFIFLPILRATLSAYAITRQQCSSIFSDRSFTIIILQNKERNRDCRWSLSICTCASLFLVHDRWVQYERRESYGRNEWVLADLRDECDPNLPPRLQHVSKSLPLMAFSRSALVKCRPDQETWSVWFQLIPQVRRRPPSVRSIYYC